MAIASIDSSFVVLLSSSLFESWDCFINPNKTSAISISISSCWRGGLEHLTTFGSRVLGLLSFCRTFWKIEKSKSQNWSTEVWRNGTLIIKTAISTIFFLIETFDDDGELASVLRLAGEVEEAFWSSQNPPFPDSQLSCDLLTEAAKTKTIRPNPPIYQFFFKKIIIRRDKLWASLTFSCTWASLSGDQSSNQLIGGLQGGRLLDW